MKPASFALSALATGCAFAKHASKLPTLTAEFALPHAAVPQLSASFGTSQAPALTVTTFAPYATDAVWVVRNLQEVVQGKANATLEQIENATQWPNMANIHMEGSKSQLLTACGFFVSASKSTGSIDLFDVSAFPFGVNRTKVSEDRKGNFYHQANFFDVDGDGSDDIVAARAFMSTNPLSKPESEMMWFKANGDGTYATKYLTQPQGDGPGVAFTLADLDNDGKTEIVAAQFFAQQALTVWECTKTHWSDCENGVGVNMYTVDNQDNVPFFNVEWVDLNGDGNKDLLATTNDAKGRGGVFGYQLTGDFRNGTAAWTKHTLATGYKPLHSILPGQGSPGQAETFQLPGSPPSISNTSPLHTQLSPASDASGASVKPVIGVSADDGGWYDVLFPSSASADDWTYDKQRLVTTKGTVGSASKLMDIHQDGSGRLSFAVALYAEGKVQVYTFD